MEKVLLVHSDDNQFINQLAEKVAEIILPAIQQPVQPPKPEKVYLTRKETAKALDVSPPTVDRFVADKLLTKYGTGKSARFRSDEVEAFYENQNKYKYHTNQ
jgi:excisionase family DNA binding protein